VSKLGELAAQRVALGLERLPQFLCRRFSCHPSECNHVTVDMAVRDGRRLA
jgi:hypothetical protein